MFTAHEVIFKSRGGGKNTKIVVRRFQREPTHSGTQYTAPLFQRPLHTHTHTLTGTSVSTVTQLFSPVMTLLIVLLPTSHRTFWIHLMEPLYLRRKHKYEARLNEPFIVDTAVL